MRRRRQDGDDDGGFTLVELLVTMTVFAILGATAITVMSSFLSVSNSISAQFKEYDQALPALSPLQSLIRAEIEPAPPDSTNSAALGAPIPGFGIDSIGSGTSVDTISDIASTFVAFHADTNYSAGPVLVVAGEYSAGVGNPCPPGDGPGHFCVGEYYPKAGTCPFSETSTAHCAYGFTTTSSPDKVLTDVSHVVANPDGQPVFTYSTFDPLATTPVTTTVPPGTETTYFQDCASPSGIDPYGTCPADAIQRVSIEITVHVTQNTLQGGTTVNLTTYRAQGNEIAPALPFQYSTLVG